MMFNDSYTGVTPPLKVKGDHALKEPQGISSALGGHGSRFHFMIHISSPVSIGIWYR